jgi:membrane protein implicated in regulation of membrane protease activity
MIIMFIVMFLPVPALPLFWAMPLVQAVPVYIVCLLLSGWMFWIMRDNMKRPVRTGIESLIGKEAEVISRSSSDKLTPYRVSLQGGIWSASSRDLLETGETVVVAAVQKNRLIVERKNTK